MLYSNHAAIRLFNKNITDFFEKPLDLDIELEHADLEGDIELKIHDKSGDFKIADVSLRKTEWNCEPCFLIIFKDVTKHRNNDTVARLGGDEFAIIISHLQDPCNAEIVAQNILNSINKISQAIGIGLCISLSIGIAIYPTLGRTPAQLIKNADNAMYLAKNDVKNQYKVYAVLNPL